MALLSPCLSSFTMTGMSLGFQVAGEIQQVGRELGISSIAAFRLFSSTFIVAEGNSWPLAVNDSPAMNRITRWLGFILEPCCQRGYCLS